MLTNNEITALSLSPTKKDFVQIWNELLEVAGKLSERWDPTSTNESDPGIVILKALTGIADKLNYNIDKNILEAFMPTAAQEDSMRKLCEMLGYNIKYYQSAKTTATIKYYNSEPSDDEKIAIEKGLLIPKFTVLTNNDKDISYFTTNETPIYITATSPNITVNCMEGQIVKCESINDNNVITINQISENNRFYLPETYISENGIFIYNIYYNNADPNGTLDDGEPWKKVDNLNIQTRGAKVFKFGYDSYESRPYIEFPDDYSELFGEGIFLYYARTNGINGNISSHTLTQLELPTLSGWSDVAATSFSVDNVFAANSGANVETIKQAYNNFKKTIGTFDTLVTCRDYMNKIYSMVSPINEKPLVSNVLVTDIRNDINRAVTICSCDDSGIFYKETPLVDRTTEKTIDLSIPVSKTVTSEVEITSNRPVFKADSTSTQSKWYLGSMELAKTKLIPVDNTDFKATEAGEVGISEDNFYTIKQNDKVFKTCLVAKETVEVKADLTAKTTVKLEGEEVPAIDHFNLVLYPFKSYNQIKNNIENITKVYDSSFTYSNSEVKLIKSNLDSDKLKTIAHTFIAPRSSKDANIGDVVCINNYLKLNATIATNTKLTVEEGSLVIDKIKIALANAFNMRQLDFGEEIPFDSIIEVIENADSRIRIASLNEPAVYTTFSVLIEDNPGAPKVAEYAVGSKWLPAETYANSSRFTYLDDSGTKKSTFDTVEAKKIFNKLALRNVLAGRVPLFNYNKTFKNSFAEGAYKVTTTLTTIPDNPVVPDEKNTITTWVKNDVIYTGEYKGPSNIVYKETKIPSEYNNGLIEENEIGPITGLETSCKVFLEKQEDGSAIIEDLKLESGEFIKFRSPNFITKKTYPAYVNYHLVRNKAILDTEVPAEATSLFDILNSDADTWQVDKTDIKWQKVLDYFGKLDTDNIASGIEHKFVHTFTISQKISKLTQAEEEKDNLVDGDIVIDITNNDSNTEDVDTIFKKSGCIKCTNAFIDNAKAADEYKKGLVAKLSWEPKKGETAPETDDILGGTNIVLELDSPFISNITVLNTIKTAVTDAITSLKAATKDDGVTPLLPTECDWKISFDFECVPLDSSSLTEWETFIRYCAISKSGPYSKVMPYKPIEENNTLFWRKFGEGYEVGKYVTAETSKLLAFEDNYFKNISDVSYLAGLYLIKNIGKDAKPAIIYNDEEYMLGPEEYLYIEYTPATTTEDGTSQEMPPVKEIIGPGTIIRPSGFEEGIIDSDIYSQLGVSPHKTVTFDLAHNGLLQVPMHRFGANEQVEIRDFAQLVLDNTSFKNSPAVYIYKNFNDCDALERAINQDEAGYRTYTLKEGECIFYTDQNKTEFGYFTTGTEVKLKGQVVIPVFDKILDLSAILDNSSGIQDIPWIYLALNTDDQIIFTEFQYRTLGKDDILKKLVIKDGKSNILDENWRFCDYAAYLTANNTDQQNPTELPDIKVGRSGNGWEVCSTFELNSSPSLAQILRKTEKIETSLTATRRNLDGESPDTIDIVPKLIEEISYPISFKTNLVCNSQSKKVDIENLYTNYAKTDSFKLKLFSPTAPMIVNTRLNSVLPLQYSSITQWSGETLKEKSSLELWNKVGLDKIHTNMTSVSGDPCDGALKLPINLLPNTYGIVCINVHYTTEESINSSKTWIETIPGIDKNTIKIFNSSDNMWDSNLNRLYLNSGINCICINKSMDLFIKTTGESEGVLLFDDIKLIDYEKLLYSIPGSDEPEEKLTLGLNLDQIGYLRVYDDSENNDLVKKETSESFQADSLNNANKKLSLVTEYSKAALQQDIKELITFLPKFKQAIELENALDKDLQNIVNTGTPSEDITMLYNNIITNKQNEEELLAKLNSDKSKDVEDIVSSLEKILNKVTYTDNADSLISEQIIKNKEIILDTISSLPKNIIISIFDKDNIMPDERLVTDIIQELSDDEKAKINNVIESLATEYTKQKEEIPNIIKSCIAEINKIYNEQIAENISKLDSILSSEERIKLNTLLDSLMVDDNALLTAELSMLLSKLKDLISNTALNTIIIDIDDALLASDYAKLNTKLTELYVNLESTNIQYLLEELEKAIVTSDNTYITELLTALSDSIEVGDDNSSLLDSISSIKTSIAQLMPIIDSEVETDIYEATTLKTLIKDNTNTLKNNLQDKINKNEELSDIILEMQNSITNNKENDLLKILNSLENNKNDQVNEILQIITSLTEKHKTFIDQLESITNDSEKIDALRDSIYKDILNDLISNTWRTNIQDRLKVVLAFAENELLLAVPGDNQVTKINTITVYTKALQKVFEHLGINLILDHSGFEYIIGMLNSMETSFNSNRAYVEVLDTISTQITNSILSDAINNIQIDNRHKKLSNTVELLKNVIAKPASILNSIEKQRLLNRLKTELEEAVASDNEIITLLDTAFFTRSMKVMSENDFNTDIFYNSLISFLENVKKTVFELKSTDDLKNDLTSYISTDNQYIKILEMFEDSLLSASLPEFTLGTLTNNTLLDTEGSILASFSEIYSHINTYKFIVNAYSSLNNLYDDALVEAINNLIETLNSKIETLNSKKTNNEGSAESIVITDSIDILTDLKNKIETLISSISEAEIEKDYEKAFEICQLENQLLQDIRKIDTNRYFYYTVPVETSLAIEFNESDDSENTLMNPATLYDINNTNNSFVISKLDIDFLDVGLQLARSSRLN